MIVSTAPLLLLGYFALYIFLWCFLTEVDPQCGYFPTNNLPSDVSMPSDGKVPLSVYSWILLILEILLLKS